MYLTDNCVCRLECLVYVVYTVDVVIIMVLIVLFFRSLPVPRRHTPYFGQPDYRIYELNKRLQQRTEVRIVSSLLFIFL